MGLSFRRELTNCWGFGAAGRPARNVQLQCNRGFIILTLLWFRQSLAQLRPMMSRTARAFGSGTIDAGADWIFIDTSIVALLGLKPVETRLVNSLTTGTSPVLVNAYRVNIQISAPDTKEPRYCCGEIIVVSSGLIHPLASGHQAMFGRGMLENCQLTYCAVMGTFTLTY
jgi:hypothetical protein